jgi:hypothetical protein
VTPQPSKREREREREKAWRDSPMPLSFFFFFLKKILNGYEKGVGRGDHEIESIIVRFDYPLPHVLSKHEKESLIWCI